VYKNQAFNLGTNDKPMGHIQMFSNTQVSEFKNLLGLKGQTWFFHVEFDSAYSYAIPILQNLLTTTIIKSQLGVDNVLLDSQNSPLPFEYQVRHKFSSILVDAFDNFCCFALALFTVGIV
jgi:hypothetical protein